MTGTWDVIVCGGGSAGIPCATFAAKRGAKVLVLEQSDRIGGTLYVSGGQMAAAGTKAQKEKGIEDSPDRHYQEVMRISKGGARADLVRVAVDGAPQTFQWLLDSGFQLTPGHPIVTYGHEPYEVPRTHWGVENGVSVLKAMKPGFDAEVAKGNITLRLNTEVQGLIKTAQGGVDGVIVRNADGRREEIKGTNIVLTTGGYASNKQLFPILSGGYPLFGGLANPQSQGTGITLAMMQGAELWGSDCYMPTFAGITDPRDPTRQVIGTVTTPQFRQPWEIFVGVDGKRFIAEDTPSVDAREHALLSQPDLTFWVVYDEGIRKAAPSFFVDLNFHALDDSGSGKIEGTNTGIMAAFDKIPGFVSAPTLAELAKKTGINSAGLEKTVTDYNKGVASGTDSMGRKHLPKPLGEGPFYAVRHHGFAVVSFAGLAVNAKLQVMRPGAQPIPGLYAAGEVLGKSLLSGKSFVGGMSLLPTITFGRLLGSQILQWEGERRAAAE